MLAPGAGGPFRLRLDILPRPSTHVCFARVKKSLTLVLRPGAGPVVGLVGLRRATDHDLVDQTEFLGFFGGHEGVALHGALDDLKGLAAVLDIDFVEPSPGPDDLAGVDFDIAGLALEPPDG